MEKAGKHPHVMKSGKKNKSLSVPLLPGAQASRQGFENQVFGDKVNFKRGFLAI